MRMLPATFLLVPLLVLEVDAKSLHALDPQGAARAQTSPIATVHRSYSQKADGIHAGAIEAPSKPHGDLLGMWHSALAPHAAARPISCRR